jgi:hypothetical protein
VAKLASSAATALSDDHLLALTEPIAALLQLAIFRTELSRVGVDDWAAFDADQFIRPSIDDNPSLHRAALRAQFRCRLEPLGNEGFLRGSSV